MISFEKKMIMFLFFLLFVRTETWKNNPFIQMLKLYATHSNASNCWVCSHLHPQTGTIPMIAMPLNFTDLNRTRINGSYIVSTANEHRSVTLMVSKQINTPQICLNITCPFNTKCRRLGNSDCTGAKITVYGGNYGQYYYIPDPELNRTLYSTNCSQFPICENIGFLRFHVIASSFLGAGIPSIRRGLYYICGNKAYAWLPTNVTGTCYIGKLVPALAVRKDTVRPDQSPEYPLVFKRELFTEGDMTWSWFPSWTGWGIEAMKRLNNYTRIVDEIINLTTTDIGLLNEEMAQLKKVVLEHRLTLNYLTAAQGGMCKIFRTDCCIYISYNEDIIKGHLAKIRELQNKARDIAKDGWNPFQGLGGFGDFLYGIATWLQKLGAYIVMFLFLMFVIYFLIRLCLCVTTRCTNKCTTSPDEPIIVRKLGES